MGKKGYSLQEIKKMQVVAHRAAASSAPENSIEAVVECIEKEKLLKPLTCKMLDCSRNYWLSKGVNDWRLVIGEESNN